MSWNDLGRKSDFGSHDRGMQVANCRNITGISSLLNEVEFPPKKKETLNEARHVKSSLKIIKHLSQ